MTFIKEFLVEIGGAVGIVLVLLIFLKNIIEKWLLNVIDTSTQKTIIKLTNSIQRSTSAYELLLNKEFEFYKKTSEYISQMVVNIQDLYYYAEQSDLDKSKNALLKILEDIPKFKNDILIYDCYLNENIKVYSTKLVRQLQDDAIYMSDCVHALYENKVLSRVQIQNLHSIEDKTLLNCAGLMSQIKSHLVELSKSNF